MSARVRADSGTTRATCRTQTGMDLLSSGIDFSSIEEIHSTFVGNRHQPFSNLQEDVEVVQKSPRVSQPRKQLCNPLLVFKNTEISL